MKRLKWLALLLLAVILFAMSEWWVRGMVYPAPFVSVPDVPPAPLVNVELRAERNVVCAWHYDGGNRRAVLAYFHGNGENLQTMHVSGFLDRFQQMDVSFIAVDYPGYGRSKGTPSEQSLQQSALAAVDFLASKYSDRVVVISGWSLGASVALRAAVARPQTVSGVIAMSPWTTLPEVAAHHFPRWLVRALLRDQHDSLEASTKIESPALIIHGEQDTLIPASMGEQIANALRGPVDFVLLPNVAHNDLLAQTEVWQKIESFLTRFEEGAIK